MKKFKPNYDEGMWKGAPAESFGKAQSLRKNETQSEKLLWERLRNNQLKGYKFRRQHPINLYIVDFYCHKLKLVIELDGEYHNFLEQIEKDHQRSKVLNEFGLAVIRFTNDEILDNLDNVIYKILSRIDEIEKPLEQ